jgi:hypothetical protein
MHTMFMYITYIAPTYFGVQNTIFREPVMPSLVPTVKRQAPDLWFHKAALVILSYEMYIN